MTGRVDAPVLGEATSDVPSEVLAALTRSEPKARAFRLDPYFRCGSRRAGIEDLLATTFVVLKPDAVAGRRLVRVTDLLECDDFEVLEAWPFRFDPLLVREFWRYQYNVATWARIEVVDLLLSRSTSLMLVLRDRRWEPHALPAACRLTAMKGSADPQRRSPGSLRSELSAPTHLFNFIHTADEPADVVRELALMEIALDREILPSLRSRDVLPRAELDRIVAALHAELPPHDLDAAESWRRLASGGGEAAALAADVCAGRETADWSALLGRFERRSPPPEALWDVLAIATAEIPHNLPDAEPIVPTVGAVPEHEWAATAL